MMSCRTRGRLGGRLRWRRRGARRGLPQAPAETEASGGGEADGPRSRTPRGLGGRVGATGLGGSHRCGRSSGGDRRRATPRTRPRVGRTTDRRERAWCRGGLLRCRLWGIGWCCIVAPQGAGAAGERAGARSWRSSLARIAGARSRCWRPACSMATGSRLAPSLERAPTRRIRWHLGGRRCRRHLVEV